MVELPKDYYEVEPVGIADVTPGQWYVHYGKTTIGVVQESPVTRALEILVFRKRYFLEDFKGVFYCPVPDVKTCREVWDRVRPPKAVLENQEFLHETQDEGCGNEAQESE